jgi:hypothetical protein
MIRSGTPSLEVAPTPSEVTGSRAGRGGWWGSQVIVVVVRDDRRIGQDASSGTGTGWKRRGPTSGRASPRAEDRIGEDSRRSSSTVEWPSQVVRSPLSAGRARPGAGPRRKRPGGARLPAEVYRQDRQRLVGRERRATGDVLWKICP